jgi:membrane associated rhomboid family serine protease
MLPRLGSSKLISTWLAVTLAASVVAAVDGGWLASWTALAPARIWRGEVWRLATWVFVERGPVALVLTCAAIFKFGGDLAHRWGERRLRRFAIEILVGVGVVTALLGLIASDAWHLQRAGGWAVGDVLVIGWARQYPSQPLTLYGFLTLRGQQLVMVTLGIAILFAIYLGPFAMAPELLACAAAAAYPRNRLRL